MRIGHIVPLIAKRYTNTATRHRALFLKGKSGIGKSQCVQQASDLLTKHIEGWQGVIDIRLSQKEPTDLCGLPYVSDGRTFYARPGFMPDEGTSGILLFDELTSAPPSVQAAAYQYILDRCMGEHRLPDGWMIIAAGNLTSDRGVTFQMAAPLLNRMCEVEVSTVLDDVLTHAMVSGVKPEVMSFLRERPDLLHKFEGKGAIEPFPSPRSWFAVSDSLDLQLPPEDRLEVLRGDVGYEAASTFETYLRMWESLPRLDDILQGKHVAVPTDQSQLWAVGMGLAARVDAKTFDNAWKFLKQAPKEMQTLCIKLAYKRDKGIASTTAFAEAAAANQSAFRAA